MLILGHAGITLGAATLIAGGVNSRHEKVSWLVSLSKYLDIRLLLVGSLLPDIIDKPVGQYLFKETFGTGRIFSHTLLFLVLLSAVGFYLYKGHRQTWMLALAAGTLAHLLLDEMWQAPATLFWPFMGFSFKEIDLAVWASNIIHDMFSSQAVYIPEIIG
ncbi:MAG: hypothetical protein A2Y90_03805, partial [Chloroflexi bacterium RBG_13_52_12]